VRILYLSPNPPVPSNTGGAQRSNLIYRALRSMGEVDLVVNATWPIYHQEELRRDFGLVADFVCERPGHLRPFRWFLKRKPNLVHRVAQTVMPRSMEYRPDRKIAAQIRRLIAERHYDVIVGRYLLPTLKAGVVGTGPALVLDVDDLDTQSLLSKLDVPGRHRWKRWIIRNQYKQLKKVVPAHLRSFDLVWITNEDERSAGEEIKALARKVYLPNIPFQSAERPSNLSLAPPLCAATRETPKVLFVGSFLVEPNRQGVDHFLRQIWPKVHKAEPSTSFRIVGSGLSEALRSRWNAVAGVDAVGQLDDLTESYAQCRFTVVPIFFGAGTNVKVLESLCFNRTSVLTDFAQRGYRDKLRDGQEVLVAKSDEAFADACIKLLRNREMCNELAARGWAAVVEHYSFERFRQTVATSIEALLSERRTGHPIGSWPAIGAVPRSEVNISCTAAV
jgi:glycosyltransferase involved in cell wall biosynthesis